MMPTVRLIVSWYFLAQAILCIGWAPWLLSDLIYSRDTPGSYALAFVPIALTGVFGLAAWALRREEPARKGWVIAASLLNLVASMAPLLLYGWTRAQGFVVRPDVFMPGWRLATIPMIFGIIGLFVFPRERSAAEAVRATSR